MAAPLDVATVHRFNSFHFVSFRSIPLYCVAHSTWTVFKHSDQPIQLNALLFQFEKIKLYTFIQRMNDGMKFGFSKQVLRLGEGIRC